MSARSNSSRAARLMGWLSFAKTAGTGFGDVAATNPVRSPRIESLDPVEEQIRAMIQGVYESKFTKAFGVPFYNERGLRNDTQYATHVLAPIRIAAFRIAKSNAQKFGYLDRSRKTDKLEPTDRAREDSRYRYQDVDTLLDNRQAYEETLGLARKSGYFRVTSEPTKAGVRYFVWPLLKGQTAPRPFATPEAAQRECDRRNHESDPRKTGRWWKMPTHKVTSKDLSDWLPPASFWRKS
jgi:hypothetical protein